MCDLQDMLNRIKNVKKERGYTNEMLSHITKIPKATLDKTLSGIIKEPPVTSITKIAKALGVTTDYLIYGKVTDEIFEKYNLLNDTGKQKVKTYINDLLESKKNTSSSSIHDLLDNDKYIAPIKQTIAAYGADETEGTDQPPIPETVL